MRIYTKFRSFKSFKNEMKADKYLKRVKRGHPTLELIICKRTKRKEDSKPFQVGYFLRKGQKKSKVLS